MVETTSKLVKLGKMGVPSEQKDVQFLFLQVNILNHILKVNTIFNTIICYLYSKFCISLE